MRGHRVVVGRGMAFDVPPLTGRHGRAVCAGGGEAMRVRAAYVCRDRPREVERSEGPRQDFIFQAAAQSQGVKSKRLCSQRVYDLEMLVAQQTLGNARGTAEVNPHLAIASGQQFPLWPHRKLPDHL